MHASACLCMPPQGPWAFLARPWAASGLPLACFLGSLKLQKQLKIHRKPMLLAFGAYACLCLPLHASGGPWDAIGSPLAASGLPLACFLGSLKLQKQIKIQRNDILAFGAYAYRCLPRDDPWAATGSPLACLRAPSGLLPGQPQASKTKGNTTKTHDFGLRSLCLPLLALGWPLGCHRLAPGLPPGSLWPAAWAASSFELLNAKPLFTPSSRTHFSQAMKIL